MSNCTLIDTVSCVNIEQLDLILLDRDGVINMDSPDFIKNPDEWLPLPDAINAIVQLQSQFKVAICTNQSGVGRGLLSEDTLAAIHAKLNDLVQNNGGTRVPIFYCPHHPDDNCPCRKPMAGLLEAAMHSHQCTPASTLFVGDSEKDLQAAANAGCQSALVLTGNGASTSATRHQHPSSSDGDISEYADLKSVADALTHRQPKRPG